MACIDDDVGTMHRSIAVAAFALLALAATDASAQENPFKEVPPAPKVDDPMLAPAPPAKRVLASWGEAVALLRARSTDIATAQAEVRRAEAQSRIALAAVLPTINGSANAPHQFITKEIQGGGGGIPGQPPPTSQTPPGEFVSGNIQLTQSIVNVQSWHAIKTAHENEQTQALLVDDTLRNVTLSVATALVAVVAAERVAELNRSGLRAALERRELTTRKRALGVATGLDVVRADQDVASARATLVTGDESLRKAREALGLAVGLPEQIGVPSGVNIDEVVSSATRTCPALNDLHERADIAAAQKKLEVADRNVENVKLSFLPTLSASSTFATTSQGSALVPTTWNIQAVLSVPIWDGGVRYGNLRSARALRDEAGFSLEAQTRAATVQVEQARRSIAVAEQSLDVAKQSRDLAAQVDQLTQIAYRAGQGTSLELVVAASALRTAEIELALREFDVIQARLAALFVLARCSGTT
jgi:outer membrane protein TolC